MRHDQRGVPRLLDAPRTPPLLPRSLVECDERFALHASVHDHQITVQNGRRGGTPAAQAGAHVGLPELLALEIKGEYTRLAEEDINSFVVGHRRTRCVAVLVSNRRLLRQFGRDLLGPGNPAAPTIQAHHVQLELLHVAVWLSWHVVAAVASQKNLFIGDDRTGRAGTRQLGLPDNILLLTPSQGQPLGRADSQPAGPPKLGPVDWFLLG